MKGIVTERHFMTAVSNAVDAHAMGDGAQGSDVIPAVLRSPVSCVSVRTPPLASRLLSPHEHLSLKRAPIWQVMTPLASMLAVKGSEPASRCLALMISSKMRHLPVLTKKGTLAGILSLRDMLTPLVAATAADEHGVGEGNVSGGILDNLKKFFS